MSTSNQVQQIASNDPEVRVVASFQGVNERIYCGFKNEVDARRWYQFNRDHMIIGSERSYYVNQGQPA